MGLTIFTVSSKFGASSSNFNSYDLNNKVTNHRNASLDLDGTPSADLEHLSCLRDVADKIDPASKKSEQELNMEMNFEPELGGEMNFEPGAMTFEPSGHSYPLGLGPKGGEPLGVGGFDVGLKGYKGDFKGGKGKDGWKGKGKGSRKIFSLIRHSSKNLRQQYSTYMGAVASAIVKCVPCANMR